MSEASFQIEGGDYEHGGAASRAVKEQLKKVGADPAVVRRAMVAAYEAEMNVVIHAHRGQMRARLENGQLDVEVIDEGPGIPDVELAMRSGYSTASARARELGFGAGMGLPNIKKNSDRFSIDSGAGRGTSVRFTIFLKPQALYGAGRHSLHVIPERCRQSFRCVTACPTQAMRVFRGKPEVLDYLCIDCTACVAACPSGALSMAGARGAGGQTPALPAADGAVLVVTAESLVQFGAGVSARRVMGELAAMGWTDVRVTAAAERALRAAVSAHAGADSGERPTISPACPAVVNLIQTRFPSLLPHVAPFVSAVEAVQAGIRGRRAVFVITCLCQQTTLLAAFEPPAPGIVPPAALRAAVLPRIAGGGGTPPSPVSSAAGAEDGGCEVLRVTGLRHVLSVLEAIENGLAADVKVVEPWACDGGCFGSPLLADDANLAKRRWDEAPLAPDPGAQVVRRTSPFAPRPGLRLDADMGKAIQKLARIDKLRRSLPGSDCAMCGAPTCAALAEDIVLGRATPDACVRQRPTEAEVRQERPA